MQKIITSEKQWMMWNCTDRFMSFYQFFFFSVASGGKSQDIFLSRATKGKNATMDQKPFYLRKMYLNLLEVMQVKILKSTKEALKV